MNTTTPQPPLLNQRRCLSFVSLFKVFIIGFLFILPLAFSSCADEEEEEKANVINNLPIPLCDTCMPPITTTGKNTFGCRINGKLWKPKEGWMRPGVHADYFSNSLSINGYNSDYREAITISIESIVDTVSLKFPEHASKKDYVLFRNEDWSKYYISEPISKGKLNMLKVDKEAGIFSGTFEFDAYNATGDTLHITEGRFDIKK